jgi:hypothetical protein
MEPFRQHTWHRGAPAVGAWWRCISAGAARADWLWACNGCGGLVKGAAGWQMLSVVGAGRLRAVGGVVASAGVLVGGGVGDGALVARRDCVVDREAPQAWGGSRRMYNWDALCVCSYIFPVRS